MGNYLFMHLGWLKTAIMGMQACMMVLADTPKTLFCVILAYPQCSVITSRSKFY